MFIYIVIVKTEYYQREKMKIKKQLNNNDKNINNEKTKIKYKSLQHSVFQGGHPSKY